MQNLDAEIPDWNFDRVREATCAKWDRELSRIQIEGTQEQKERWLRPLAAAQIRSC